MLMEMSDFEEVLLPIVGVWNSATTMPGAQCVTACGAILTLVLPADN